MLILLVNLARRPDRLAFMAQQMDALGLRFVRVDAVDCQLDRLGPENPALTRPEQACVLSHRKAWEQFIASGEPFCLILEDDVLLARETPGLLTTSRPLPADAELVRLETRLMRTDLGRGLASGMRRHRFHRQLSLHEGSAAYIISRGCAQRALRALHDLAEPIDRVLFDPHGPFPAVRYQLRPACCLQLELFAPARASIVARSDIEACRNARYAAHPPAHREPRPRLSIARKGIRELRRAARRIRHLAQVAYLRLRHGRAWRDVPFTGSLPPAVASSLEPNATGIHLPAVVE